MSIQRNGSQPAAKGPAEYFTGNVRVDPLFQAPDPAHATGGVITCAPGKRHWHGATSTTAMSHIAITERDANGKVVDWMEKVRDEQYLA